jgi:pimeloyl-ACP methyl ester carboxylesterase
VYIPPVGLEGDLLVTPEARGIVVFAHGSGSSRHSPRNRFVAGQLNAGNQGTLLFDLLTPEEERSDALTGRWRFDINLLADRLIQASDWLKSQPDTRDLKIGYFGASTGGGAALVATARRPAEISAVVSRGGRPDLAGDALHHVQAPTLLIVGGHDEPVIEMNQWAYERIPAPEKRLEIVTGATHLFEEPGTLEQVASLARHWFATYLK